jgi:hypothetical protein
MTDGGGSVLPMLSSLTPPTMPFGSVELFEARKPREAAVISEMDGVVRHGGIVKGQRPRP